MLADCGARPDRREAGHGRDVQGRDPSYVAAPCPDDVNGPLRQVQRLSGRHHGPDQAGRLLGRLPLDLQPDEETGNLGRFGLSAQDLGQDGLSLVGRQVLSVAQAGQQAGPTAEVVKGHGRLGRSG